MSGRSPSPPSLLFPSFSLSLACVLVGKLCFLSNNQLQSLDVAAIGDLAIYFGETMVISLVR